MAKQPKWMLYKGNGTVVPFNKEAFDGGKYEAWEPAPFEYPKFVDAALEEKQEDSVPAKRKYNRKAEAEQQSEVEA